ncbi:MAG: hypothetical protein RLO48_19630, partial [Bauldia litoralis]
MSHLPFIRAVGRPADLPALVISPPLADPTPPEVILYAVTSSKDVGDADGIAVLARWESGGIRDTLVAAPADLDRAAIEA